MTTLLDDPDLTLRPPVSVPHPTMLQRWTDLAFIHLPCDPHEVQRRLPRELTVDTVDGTAWVGIVPFRLRLRLPGTPYLPWFNTLDEVNLRTYVRGPDGARGIWFLSLDAGRLGAVALARATYRIPYVWARTRTVERGGTIRYRSARRHPGATAARLDTTIDRGGPIVPGDLERFLTNRWHLYSPGRQALPPTGVRLDKTTVEHEPWPLHAAKIVHLEETLLAAAGLAAVPAPAPTAMWSPGVSVRFARRHGV